MGDWCYCCGTMNWSFDIILPNVLWMIDKMYLIIACLKKIWLWGECRCLAHRKWKLLASVTWSDKREVRDSSKKGITNLILKTNLSFHFSYYSDSPVCDGRIELDGFSVPLIQISVLEYTNSKVFLLGAFTKVILVDHSNLRRNHGSWHT